MVFDPFLFKDGKDFLQKMGFTIEEGLEFLDNELKKREGANKCHIQQDL